MVPVTFKNVPMAFKRWERFIPPRATGKCNVRARPPTRNLPNSSEDFSSQTMHRIGSKSSLCNSPGESLYAGKRSTAIQCSVPEISRGQRDRRTDTHSTSINIREDSRSTYHLYSHMLSVVHTADTYHNEIQKSSGYIYRFICIVVLSFSAS